MYWSIILNFLLIAAVIIDRIYRLKSIKEFREAKEAVVAAKDATIESLKLQLEASEKNNDIKITEMHRQRVESVKIIVEEQEQLIEQLKSKIEGGTTQDSNLEATLSQILELVIKNNERTKVEAETYQPLTGRLWIGEQIDYRKGMGIQLKETWEIGKGIEYQPNWENAFGNNSKGFREATERKKRGE